MEEARKSVHCATDAICDGLKHLGDFSYAIFPADVAHALADLKKSVLTNVRNCIDWEIEWINERVAGGDRLREEWRERCQEHRSTEKPPEPVV